MKGLLNKRNGIIAGVAVVFIIIAIVVSTSFSSAMNLDQAKEIAQGYVPEVPDYAFDVHTAKGRAKGRDIIHFIDVASQVTPQMEGYDDTYRLKFREVLKNEMENNIQPKDGSFEYTID